MRRKLISLITALTLMCVSIVVPCTASAATVASGECGDEIVWILKDGTITLMGTGDMYSYTLGNTPWEAYKDEITALVVGYGVTSISDYAFCFEGQSYLKEAYIPTTVTSIGAYAIGYRFSDSSDSNIERVSTTVYAEVGTAAFQYAAANSLNFSSTGSSYDDNEIIESGTCGDNLTWSVTGGGVLTISGSGAMESSHSYVGSDGEAETSVYPEWHKYGFFVTDVIIGKGITNIAKYAFSGFSMLTSVIIPDTVTDIGDRAFYGCAFTGITIPESVTGIGMYAFSNCDKLTSITLPEGIEGIESRTFAYCSDLAEIVIPESVEYIYDYAFYSCTVLASVYYTGTSDAWSAIDIDESGNDELLKADRYYNYSGSGGNPDYVYKQYTINTLNAAWSDEKGALAVTVGVSTLDEPMGNKYYMLAAAYDADGNFLDLGVYTIDYSETFDFYLTVDPDKAAGGTVKATVWQDLDGLTPICNCISADYSIEL